MSIDESYRFGSSGAITVYGCYCPALLPSPLALEIAAYAVD